MTFDPKNPQDVQFESFLADDSDIGSIINSSTVQVIQDKFGSYWIGTFSGVAQYINQDGREFFENYSNESGKPHSLSNNAFRCFFKDSKGRLWIGTRSGLNLVQQNEKYQRATFKVFGSKDGLPNDVIHAIEEDERGLLWISTNRGLVLFDPEATKPVLKVYDERDGLSNSTFVFRASFKDKAGNIYFGAANGLNYFNPADLPVNHYLPPVRFTKLKVLNKIVKPSQGKTSILQQSITYTDKIILQYWQNIITLEFAAMDFNKPEKNQYQYRLSSLHQDWVANGNDNTVTFTNLSPGKHTLLVKGSNNDSIWNENPTRLIIEVLPPIWKTWWAYSLYFLLFAGAVFLFIRIRIRQKLKRIEAEAKLEKARLEEREILRKKNAADFHDELGHRFTKISLFLELAERQSESGNAIKEYLQKIKSNALGLSEGIRDLIWNLDPKKDSMYQTLTRLQEFGNNLFEFSSIYFKTDSLDPTLEEMELAPDIRKNILLIFKEAMNNCLKYSAAQNAVFKVRKEKGLSCLIFQDDGKGFDKYSVKNGYGLKNMESRAAKINSKLEINSQPGKGTEIVFHLNIPHKG